MDRTHLANVCDGVGGWRKMLVGFQVHAEQDAAEQFLRMLRLPLYHRQRIEERSQIWVGSKKGDSFVVGIVPTHAEGFEELVSMDREDLEMQLLGGASPPKGKQPTPFTGVFVLFEKNVLADRALLVLQALLRELETAGFAVDCTAKCFGGKLHRISADTPLSLLFENLEGGASVRAVGVGAKNLQ